MYGTDTYENKFVDWLLVQVGPNIKLNLNPLSNSEVHHAKTGT
jgi:hypothetical protein